MPGVLLLAFLGLHPSLVRAAQTARVGTVPFIFDDNRVFAELTFIRPDGSMRKARAFVDMGTPVMTVNQKLRKELEIDQQKRLVFRLGELEIEVASSQVETDTGAPMTGPDGKRTVPVEAILPGSVLKNYQVIFDYERRTLTIARPNTLRPRGTPVRCRVNEKTGLVSVTATIGAQPFRVAIDSGSAYSWLRKDIAEPWVTTHPNWKRGTGAVGESNMQTRADGAEAGAIILRLPEIRIGSLSLKQIGALGIMPQAPPFPPAPGESEVSRDFFDWYSRKAPEPVIGWLGGNVLAGFRLMIDFPRHMTYWEREKELDPYDLDQVGVTLERRPQGYFIAGIAKKRGRPTVEGVQVGDQLIQVDDVLLANATRGAVFSALHGRPAATRVLILERDGKRITVPTKITAF